MAYKEAQRAESGDDREGETFVLVNPAARDGEVGRRWPEMERELQEALGGSRIRTAFTSLEDLGSRAVREALRSGVRRVAVVGGDGTLSEAVQGFFEEPGSAPGAPASIAPDAALICLPAGRGDDFFKSLHGRRVFSSKSAWTQALELIRRGRPQPTDIGRVELRRVDGNVDRRYFINIASFGYPGLVVKRVAERAGFLGKTWLGRSAWTYLLQSATGLKNYRPIPTRVRVDGKPFFEGGLFSGFALNGRYNAGGVCWVNATAVDDGKFHLIVFEPQSLAATLLNGHRMLSGEWDGVPGVHVASGATIEIETEGSERRGHPLFEIDGDQPEKPVTSGARLETLPGAIRFWR